MKNNYFLLILFLFGCSINAQVGINTNNPKASLHVQKREELTFADGIIPPRISGDSLRLKAAAYDIRQNGAIVYVTSPVTNPNPATEPKTQDVGSSGFFVYDANYTHPNTTKGVWNRVRSDDGPVSSSGTYAARFKGNLSLVDITLSLFTTTFNYLPLSASNATVTTEIASTHVTSNQYTVPSDGIYHIDFSFRTGTGVIAQLLSSNPPGIAIVKTVGATSTLLDYREFGGVNLVVANLTLTQGQINHIYNLKKGDILRFGLIKGGLDLGLITDKSAELSIYKVR